MLSLGTLAPPRSAPSLISMHLCFYEEDGSFLPPKCSIFILIMLLGMSLQMIVSTSLLLDWFLCRASRPFSSKPPTVIESFPDFIYHFPFYASVEIAALSFFFFFPLVVDCVWIFYWWWCFLRADVIASIPCVLCEHLAKCSKQKKS